MREQEINAILCRSDSGRGGCSFQFGRTSMWRPRAPHLAHTTLRRTPALPVPRLSDPAGDRRRAHIAADPKLRAIAEVFGEEVSWQKLRFALEKIWALVGNNEQALIKHRYATKSELDRFNESAHDPRLSGTNALPSYHSPRPPMGPTMTEADGLAFIVRVLNTYIDRRPEPAP